MKTDTKTLVLNPEVLLTNLRKKHGGKSIFPESVKAAKKVAMLLKKNSNINRKIWQFKIF
ncbi:MAG: hypothetical protein EAZ27_08045 [Cytophagales bacterium]|nr:MAG: hypothetical protein EAZ27_08045 [Cytophagales bacterium]